jgi:Uncharacterized protein conserved in bacteria (DUF2330)
MKQFALVSGLPSLSAVALTLATVCAGEREAAACGGCFHPPPPPTQTASDITDERMLLAVSTKQTTLYDQIRYSGSPTSFAWVLPIHGTVDVGLSADILFGSMDSLTSTEISAPPKNCPPPPPKCQGYSGGFAGSPSAGAAGGSSSSGGSADIPAVTVTKQENVGPYATVQLHSTTSGALTQWLSDNGFQIPDNVKPVIEQYVTEGFDFLAMKLLPNQGIQAMRPVRVTTGGASFALPLRMAAIGTGNSVGITIWVVADGRYQPQNFPFYRVEDKDLIWDWSTEQSNYTLIRAQTETSLGNKGWELESSITLNQQLITNLITGGGYYYGNYGNGAPASNASNDYLPVAASGSTPAQTADDVRAADIAGLFAGMNGPNVRVTRMRSDISHDAMKTDFVLQASADQSELSNVRTVTQSINLTCPLYDTNCNIVGSYPYGPQGTLSGTIAGSSSGTSPPGPAPAAQPTAGGGGGCTATAKQTSWSDLGLSALGVMGLAALVRARTQRSRKPKR